MKPASTNKNSKQSVSKIFMPYKKNMCNRYSIKVLVIGPSPALLHWFMVLENVLEFEFRWSDAKNKPILT